MGKKKIKVVGKEEAKEQKKRPAFKKQKPEEPVVAEKKEAITEEKNAVEKVEAVKTEKNTDKKEENAEPKEEKKEKVKKEPKSRGKKYLSAKKKVDPDLLYPVLKAIALVKETSISSFVGTLEAHIQVKTAGDLGELVLPHSKEEGKRVVTANDEIIAEIKEGKINFDVLLASPKMMAKIVPFARTLGPKGLMPNPKNGTLVENPEEAVAKFSKGGFRIKTEKKAPVAHLRLGKLDQPDKELIANVEELIKTIGVVNIEKMFLKATMGPAVKVKI
ncbi:MAG: hypothetical protein ABH867_03420 [Patescibacteria group bacterium]|nr:hypothetical protein [Patescibacteria group bacterium]